MAPVTPPPASAVEAPATGIMDRAQRFIEDNQKAILIGCGVAAAAGAGYYFYSRSGSAGPGPSSGSSASGKTAGTGSSKNKKKKKSKKNEKFIKGEGSDGPLLEEIKPSEKVEAVSDDYLAGVPDAAGLAAMSEAERNTLGATLKDRGNKLYSKKEFKKAVECYTKAIEVSVKKDAVFYSNRAACEYARWTV